MNKENTLSRASRLPVQAGIEDMWGTGTDLSLAGKSQQQPAGAPIKKLHRLLRGRYLIAAILAGAGAVIGGIMGYRSQVPLYRSQGLIKIEPVVYSMESMNHVMPMWQDHVNTQVARILGQRVAEMTIAKLNTQDVQTRIAEIRKTDSRAVVPDLVEFTNSLNVVSSGTLIQISYTHPNPKMAQEIVACTIASYKDIVDLDEQARSGDPNNFSVKKLKELDEKRIEANRNRDRARKTIDEISKIRGTDDLSQQYNAMIARLMELEAEYSRVNLTLTQAKQALQDAQANATTQPADAANVQQTELVELDVAKFDPMMRSLIQNRLEVENEIRMNEQVLGKAHPTVRRLTARLDVINARIQELLKSYNEGRLELPAEAIASGPVNEAQIRALESRLKIIFEALDAHRQETKKIGQDNATLRQARTDIERLSEEIERLDRQIDRAEVQYQITPRQFTVNSWGDRPLKPYIDKRVQTGLVGFVGGGAIPMALLLLIGLLDTRYRYSDDTDESMAGVPLLGILPNLPDLLTDPEQAAVAAHCVHQIRTMLQIGGHVEERRVYAVTSASPGDGKTSLTLALGLSFAASGSRTLLIDCDLVGGGLTHRLGINSPEGILEAMSNRSLLDYVQSADVADLSVLPVGGAHAHHASSFSPAAMRRLISEARKHFDTILIDTGPILGSIEASPVAATADGVILAVSRGQQRPLVEKALSLLTSIRASIAGVVFNRAQTRDFERSVSRMSMRSVNGNGNGNGDSGEGLAVQRTSNGGFGPVARAVQSSFKPSNGNDLQG